MLNPAQDNIQRVDQPDRHEYRPLEEFHVNSIYPTLTSKRRPSRRASAREIV
jgi:hypothetical protein